jgi:hypothetical protein
MAVTIPSAEMMVFPEGTHMVLLEEVDRIAKTNRAFIQRN